MTTRGVWSSGAVLVSLFFLGCVQTFDFGDFTGGNFDFGDFDFTGGQTQPGQEDQGRGHLPEFANAEEEWVYSHNLLRCMHGVGPLTYDNSLEREAKAWNDVLDKKSGCSHLEHSRCNASDFRQCSGENLFWGSSSPFNDCSIEGSCEPDYSRTSSSWGWWIEILDYNFQTGRSNGGAVGHFTQMVWGDTERVGCDMCKKDGSVLYTCEYRPLGNFNMIGDQIVSEKAAYTSNVQCIKRSEQECKCMLDRGVYPDSIPRGTSTCLVGEQFVHPKKLAAGDDVCAQFIDTGIDSPEPPVDVSSEDEDEGTCENVSGKTCPKSKSVSKAECEDDANCRWVVEEENCGGCDEESTPRVVTEGGPDECEIAPANREDCGTVAKLAGVFSKKKVKQVSKKKLPRGCFVKKHKSNPKKNKAFFNIIGKSDSGCSAKKLCVCGEQ